MKNFGLIHHWIESAQLGYHLSWLRRSWLCSVSRCDCRCSHTKWATITASEFLTSSWSILIFLCHFNGSNVCSWSMVFKYPVNSRALVWIVWELFSHHKYSVVIASFLITGGTIRRWGWHFSKRGGIFAYLAPAPPPPPPKVECLINIKVQNQKCNSFCIVTAGISTL
jgi:hypothetical protein